MTGGASDEALPEGVPDATRRLLARVDARRLRDPEQRLVILRDLVPSNEIASIVAQLVAAGFPADRSPSGEPGPLDPADPWPETPRRLGAPIPSPAQVGGRHRVPEEPVEGGGWTVPTAGGDGGGAAHHRTPAPAPTPPRPVPPSRTPLPSPGGARRRARIALVLLLAVAAVAGAWLVAVRSGSDPGGAPALPGLVGKGEAGARQELDGLGVGEADIEVRYERSDDEEPGTVIEQDPAAGESLRSDGQVVLTVAVGPDVELPTVDGRPRTEALTDLAAAGFGVKVTLVHDEAAAGTVLATDPPGGTALPEGALVRVQVSSGPKRVGVPDVVGMNAVLAAEKLQGRGFTVKVKEEISDRPPGTVLRQDPAALDSGPRGSQVTIVMAVAAPASGSSPTTMPGTDAGSSTDGSTDGSGGGSTGSSGGSTATTAPGSGASGGVAPTVATTQPQTATTQTQTATTRPPTTTCRTVVDVPGYYDADAGAYVPEQTHRECG